MLRNVKISEKESDIIVAEYPIIIGYIGVSERDFFDKAWISAIEDALVDPDKKLHYKFVMTDGLS